MGLGYFLHEDVVHNANGRPASNGTWEYKPPCTKTIPLDLRVALLKDSPFPKGVLRSKSVGEPPFILSYGILEATRNAIQSARDDAKLTGWCRLDAPLTIDRVQQACGVKVADMTL
jgi:xanthine dehydrogenase/oxidase